MRLVLLFAVIGLLVGVGVGQGVKLISSRVKSQLRACVCCCILGVAAMMVMMVTGYLFYFGTGAVVHGV